MKKSNASALIPIGVFVVFYLSLGIIFEYVMKIPMGFYNVPVVVAMNISLPLAGVTTRPTVETPMGKGKCMVTDFLGCHTSVDKS